MKPIPAETETDDNNPSGGDNSMSSLLGRGSANNRRMVQVPPVPKSYPVLLILSTLTAAAFCYMYLTKPVIVPGTAHGQTEGPSGNSNEIKAANLMPNTDQLPGKIGSSREPQQPLLTSPVVDQYEETNLRIQHILTAKSPDGYTGRIDIEVPALYESRQLRWTEEEVSRARELLGQLKVYQSKSQQLRGEGDALLAAWNELIATSIPTEQLRADSPSLPLNQHGGNPGNANQIRSNDSTEPQTSQP